MFQKLKTQKGAALITAYFVITSLITLGTGFAMMSINELNNARRYRDSAEAFWTAEAGINQFVHDTTMLDDTGSDTITLGSHSATISKDDSDPQQRVVTAVSVVGGQTRTVQVSFPKNPPGIFSNTLSGGLNFHTIGASLRSSYLNIYGKMRFAGIYDDDAFNLVENFQDPAYSQPSGEVTLTYPDADGDGTAHEFDDFVAYNRALVDSYPEDETLHIIPETDEDVVYIYPNSTYKDEPIAGKKIVFVDDAEGEGDVEIIFGAGWQDHEDLTVITTGSVSYFQPLENAVNDSNLNVIAWDDYSQASLLVSYHNGVIFANDQAFFTEVLSESENTGVVIANGLRPNDADNVCITPWNCYDPDESAIHFTEFLQTTKDFYYANPIEGSQVPFGFEGLISAGGSGYSSTPNSWKEL